MIISKLIDSDQLLAADHEHPPHLTSSDHLRILEVTRVTPPPSDSTAADDFTLHLTLFDTLLLKAPPVKRLFFYSLNPPHPHPPLTFFNTIIPNLKHSLSLALAHYLPLAGRLTWPPAQPKPVSTYLPNHPDHGLSFTVAESTAHFAALSSKTIKYVSDLHALLPPLDCSEPISLQVTLFPNAGGFSLGITANHLIQDGQSTAAFIKAWAQTCRQAAAAYNNEELMVMTTPPPSFDRTRIKDPTRLDLLYLNQWMDFTDPQRKETMKLRLPVESFPPDLVLKTFELSGEDIQRLKSKIVDHPRTTEQQHRRRPSTFVVTMAYTMTCLVRVKAESGDQLVSIGFPADGRAWLDPPLPANYFGNCIIPVYGETAPAEEFMKEGGFEFAVRRLSDTIERLESDPLAEMEEKVTKLLAFVKSAGKGEGMVVSVTDSPRFGFYEVDFGWGRPELVELVSADRGGVMGLGESRDDKDGVEVALAMSKHEMDRFVHLFAALKLP